MEKIVPPGIKASTIKPNVHDIALEVLKCSLEGARIPEELWEEASELIADFSYTVARKMVERGEKEDAK